MAAKAQGELYAALKRDGGSHEMLDRMQTRDELSVLMSSSEQEGMEAARGQKAGLKNV